MFRAALVWLLAHRRLVQVVSLIGALALVPGLARLGTDNSPEVFFVQGSPELAEYRDLSALFGSDQVLRIAVAGEALWTSEGLAWLDELEANAAAVAGVEAVSGLASRYSAELLELPPGGEGELKKRALADPLDRALGRIDATGELATVLVVLTPGPPAEQRATLAALSELAARPPAGLRVSFVGLAVMNEALDGSSREIQTRFFPLLVVFTLLLLGLTFRDLASVLVPLLFVAVSELAMLGPMGYLGVELNLVLAVLPPLTYVIGLATAVHLLVRYREGLAAGLDPAAAVLETYHDKGWAVLWTGVTTLVGFGSLTTSAVGPVTSLGLWSSIGIGVQTLLAFTLYPVLLAAWVGAHFRGERRLEAVARVAGRSFAEGSVRHRRPLLLGVLLVSIAAALGLLRLDVESNALHYLPEEHPLRTAVAELEARGIGTAALELVIRRGEGGPSLREERSLEQLRTLAERLRRVPEVRGVVGAGDVEAAVRSSQSAPTSSFGALTAAAVLERSLSPFLTADGAVARLTLFVPTAGFDRLDPVIAAAQSAAREVFPGARMAVTGELPLLLAAQRNLLSTLGSSFSLTLLAVGLILGLLVGSVRLALLALVPNVWPVLGALGVMGWLGLPLDVATVMVASVILGIAVDDTIHTLGHFRELAPRIGAGEAVASTLEHTAGAYLVTGAMLIAGFGVCALSSFAPTSRFGLATSLGIALALVGDLFVVPALLAGKPQGS